MNLASRYKKLDARKNAKSLMNKNFNNLNTALVLAVLAGSLLSMTGCGEKNLKLTEDQSKAFKDAPAETKQTWDKALSADHGNDYIKAHKLLDSLRSMNLNSQQIEALDMEIAAFQQRLLQAVEKNDPAATKAILEINQTKSRR